MSEVVLTIEATITFDPGRSIPKKFNQAEIRDAVSSALAGCSQIENVGNVAVDQIRIER